MGAPFKLINTHNNIYVIWDKKEMKGPTIYDDVEFTPRCVDPNDNDVGSIVVVIWILVMVSFFERCGQFNPFLLIIFQHNNNLYFVLNWQFFF